MAELWICPEHRDVFGAVGVEIPPNNVSVDDLRACAARLVKVVEASRRGPSG